MTAPQGYHELLVYIMTCSSNHIILSQYAGLQQRLSKVMQVLTTTLTTTQKKKEPKIRLNG